MAMRPPKTFKERFLQGAAAGGMSVGFTKFVLRTLDGFVGAIDFQQYPPDDMMQITLAVGFGIGAVSWAVVGLVLTLRDRALMDQVSIVQAALERLKKKE
jgi:hypothetical protein